MTGVAGMTEGAGMTGVAGMTEVAGMRVRIVIPGYDRGSMVGMDSRVRGNDGGGWNDGSIVIPGYDRGSMDSRVRGNDGAGGHEGVAAMKAAIFWATSAPLSSCRK